MSDVEAELHRKELNKRRAYYKANRERIAKNYEASVRKARKVRYEAKGEPLPVNFKLTIICPTT